MNFLPFLPNEHQISYSEERIFIEKIKKLPIYINSCIEMILLYRNLKTAIDVVVITKNEMELQEIRNTFSSFGFFFEEGMRQYTVFYLSKKDELAKELKILFEEKNENSRRLGVLSGFPKTAVDAYENDTKEGTLFDTKPETLFEKIEELKFHGVMMFAQFRFSRKYWKDELEIPKKWANEVWRIAPELYFYFLEEKHDSLSYPLIPKLNETKKQ